MLKDVWLVAHSWLQRRVLKQFEGFWTGLKSDFASGVSRRVGPAEEVHPDQ
jgi:hypothetical protein